MQTEHNMPDITVAEKKLQLLIDVDVPGDNQIEKQLEKIENTKNRKLKYSAIGERCNHHPYCLWCTKCDPKGPLRNIWSILSFTRSQVQHCTTRNIERYTAMSH